MSAIFARPCPTTGVSAARVYRRRRPERTALYRLVQQHLETWLAGSRDADPEGAPIPRHVERELRGYLECGILACGFARARCGECGHDFLVAFSCKGRGLCPSCTTRRMAETAVHLVEHVFPQVLVRQWVITFPKATAILSAPRPGAARPGAAHRLEGDRVRTATPLPRSAARRALRSGEFRAALWLALNAHTHLHCCVTDGVFGLEADGTLRFYAVTDCAAAAISVMQRRIRTRVLRTAVRQGALSPEVAANLARWGHGGGFSLHAAVRIEAQDRAGLERLLRYCARPAFASEWLAWDGSDQPVRYALPKPLPTGQTELTLAPLELLDRLAALIPPPRRHRHHYAGVFAPHATLRARVTACAGQPVAAIAPVTVSRRIACSPPPRAGTPHSTGPGCWLGSTRFVPSPARAATARCA